MLRPGPFLREAAKGVKGAKGARNCAIEVQKQMSMRFLHEVDDRELVRAITAMCQQLQVPGSVAGQYDLYKAALAEKRRAAEPFSEQQDQGARFCGAQQQPAS